MEIKTFVAATIKTRSVTFSKKKPTKQCLGKLTRICTQTPTSSPGYDLNKNRKENLLVGVYVDHGWFGFKQPHLA